MVLIFEYFFFCLIFVSFFLLVFSLYTRDKSVPRFQIAILFILSVFFYQVQKDYDSGMNVCRIGAFSSICASQGRDTILGDYWFHMKAVFMQDFEGIFKIVDSLKRKI